MDRPLAGVPAVRDLFAPTSLTTSLTTSFTTKPYDQALRPALRPALQQFADRRRSASKRSDPRVAIDGRGVDANQLIDRRGELGR